MGQRRRRFFGPRAIPWIAVFGFILTAHASRDGHAAEFVGWQGMRVVPQEGAPERIFAADLDASGRQTLVVVNTRHSRLDLYQRRSSDERKPPYPTDPERPNELPLAADWSHTELPLEDLPAAAAAVDLDGDGKRELLVLTGPTLKLSAYHKPAGKWERMRHWDLPSAAPVGRGPLLLVRDGDAGKREALISCEQGVLVVPLTDGGRAGWFRPRETVPRFDWRLVDVDGDADLDLLEWTAKANQSLRWYENVAGVLRAPQTLHDTPLQQLTVVAADGRPADVFCLASAQTGIVRHFRPAPGDESPFGCRASLPIASGPTAPWCGLRVGNVPALAAIDPAEPRIRLYRLVDDRWGDEETYPTLGNVRAIAAPAAKPGTLLLWIKDAGDLHESRWEEERLSYPKPLAATDAPADRKILALDTVGTTVWWAQRRGADVELSVWNATDPEPQRSLFPDVGAKTDRVLWLSGRKLLVQQAYAGGAKLLSLDRDEKSEKYKLTSVEPPHLAKVNLAEYALYDDGKRLRVGRLTDGVLQWLGDDLQPIDQVMPADGQKLAAYVPLGESEALALEQGGQFLHQLHVAPSGMVRTTGDIKVSGATGLRRDPVLGVLLIDSDRIVRLTPGKPWELKLVDTIDGRVGRPSGVREATIHRLAAADADGDGRDEVVLFDDRRHQLTLLGRREERWESLASWQAFEDRKYPYGDGDEGVPIAEPRAVVSFDADGDSFQDFALLSQDRLLIYVGREEKP